MTKRLAIIPARAGSKRIKNKNIINFYHKPLILYSLFAARKSNLFNKIHISTDSQKIKKIVEANGFDIDFLRDKKLAGDNVPISDVMNFIVKEYKSKNSVFDEIWLLYATNPFINDHLLKKAYKKYLKFNKKYSVMSVNKYNLPIEWAQYVNKKGILKAKDVSKISTDSKKLKGYYCDAGMFIIYQKDFIYNNVKPDFLPFEIPWWESVDIDNIDDLTAAGQLFQK